MPAILIALYAVAQIVASLQGLETYLGVLGALFIIGLCLYFRFTLPLTIAAFLCAKNVWGWHWFFALLFVAPGLAFLLPAIAAVVVASLLAIMPWGRMPRARRRPVDDGIIEGEYEEVFDPGARPMSGVAQPHDARQPARQRSDGRKKGGPAGNGLARRGLKVAGYVMLVGVVGIIAINVLEHRRQPDAAAASYNEVEPINDVPDYATPVEAPADEDAGLASSIPALDQADLHMAVSEFDRVYSDTGMSGAVDYSRDCHNRLAVSHMPRDFDRCIGFDWAAALVDAAAVQHGMPVNYYFQGVVADDSQQAAGRLVSDDGAVITDRIRRIRAETTEALSQLGAAKMAGNGDGASSPDTADGEANLF